MSTTTVVSAASGAGDDGRRCAHGTLEQGQDVTMIVAESATGSAGACVAAALARLEEVADVSADKRIRAAFAAAEREVEGLDAALSMSVVVFSGNQVFSGQIGAATRACLIRDNTLVELCPAVAAETLFAARSAVNLSQSDRVVLFSSDVSETVEPTLMPKLMEHRPPDRCIESILKLARHRGLEDDHVLLVAAWQDPELETIPHEFEVPMLHDESGDTIPHEFDARLDTAEVVHLVDESPDMAPKPATPRNASLLTAAMALIGLAS